MSGVSDLPPVSLAATLGSLTSASVGRAQLVPAMVRRPRSQSDAREDRREDQESPPRPRLPAGAIPSETKLLDLFV